MIELRRECWTHQRIADDLGVNRATVTKYLVKLARASEKQLEDRVVAERIAQLDQLDDVADMTRQAWQSEKNPALLGQLRGALADKRSLLGLDAPQKFSHSDPDGSPLLSGLAKALETVYGGGPAGPGSLPDGGS